MIGFFIRWFTNTVALLVVINVVPGIQADRWETIAVAALILGFLNAFLGPIIILLTLPLQVLSLGFVTLLTNGLMFYLVSKLVEGFHVASFWNAFFGALLFSIVSFFLNLFVDPDGKFKVRFYQSGTFRRPKSDDVIDVEGKTKDDNPNKRISNL